MASAGKRAAPSGLRDINNVYLFALAETIPVDFILTGDKDLLSLQTHRQTKIITFNEFKAMTCTKKTREQNRCHVEWLHQRAKKEKAGQQ